jgi:ribonucleotide monophosphatase NagD (HAD superfamily)
MSNSFKKLIHEEENKIIAIDFDGVIHSFEHGFHDGTIYGTPIQGSKESLELLSKEYTLILFTAKAKPDRPLVNGKTGTQLVWEWLEKYGIADCIHEVTAEKPRSFLYIDDNAYRFENWKDTTKYLNTNYDKS